MSDARVGKVCDGRPVTRNDHMFLREERALGRPCWTMWSSGALVPSGRSCGPCQRLWVVEEVACEDASESIPMGRMQGAVEAELARK